MSAVAYYCRRKGIAVSGSDRLAHSVDMLETRGKLESEGCVVFPQDGSALSRAPDGVVVSTAIEETNPDIVAARKRGTPIVHRSDVLAALASEKRTIAIAGTSGKSTVAAMVFEMLAWCGKSPSLITGANLVYLEEKGLLGNAFYGASDLLVIEADESDGSLIKYEPDVGVFLNVSKDHKPVEETLGLFRVLAGRSKCVIVNADDPALDIKDATLTFGLSDGAGYRPDRVDSIAPTVAFFCRGVRFELPLPGGHNVSNALAALSVCDYLGCDSGRCADALRVYKGVKRRFSSVKLPNGVTVIDDFAHNPEKVKAAVSTAKLMSRRVLAVFQPHGFGPTRFLKDDFVRAFCEILDTEDALYLLPIYYAGGTALKDISSDELAALVNRKSRVAFAPKDREECLAMLKVKALPGDAVLLMGARDPSLPAFARRIAEELRSL
jgi:UDP-N-acetylmuramate--alanine ligase